MQKWSMLIHVYDIKIRMFICFIWENKLVKFFICIENYENYFKFWSSMLIIKIWRLFYYWNALQFILLKHEHLISIFIIMIYSIFWIYLLATKSMSLKIEEFTESIIIDSIKGINE
jgi:hypothetical protein